MKLWADLQNLKFGEEKDNAASERVGAHLEVLQASYTSSFRPHTLVAEGLIH